MALKAGYRGIKKYIADKLNRMNPGDSFATDAEIAAETDKVRADIAPVLEEAKAPTGGISDGDQFFLNDILYTASADISAGANIVTTGEGKNADVSSNVTEQLAAAVQQLTSIKVDNSVIGNVETASASTHAYTAGQGFICDGQYRVAKGDGISIGDEITDSNSDVNPIADCIATKYLKASVASGETNITIDNTQNYLIQFGIFVYINVRITVAEDITGTAGHRLIVLPIQPKMISLLQFSKSAAPYELVGKIAYTVATSNIVNAAGLIEAGTYDISGITIV